MNRRYALKSILAYGLLSAGAVSLYEFARLNRSPDIDYIQNNKKLLAQLAEVIIPRTDTPGAKDAGVEEYIVHALIEIVPKKTFNNFVDGLKELEGIAKKRFGKAIIDCSMEQIESLLNDLNTELKMPGGELLRKIDRKLRGESFFDTLRELTIVGYCTSEVGATQGLAYDHIPVNFLPCIPWQNGQRSWATK